jgi:hypothetical protein
VTIRAPSEGCSGRRAFVRDLSPADAFRRLGDWGFVAHPDLPDGAGPAYLIVSLRDRPTLRHFDPELVQYWRTRAGRGTPATLDRATSVPFVGEFAWGGVRVSDRLHVSNEYVTFGGRLEADAVGDATVAVFASPAPILALGGHSQLADETAADVSAFLARLLVAVEERPGIEARVATAGPLTLYAAFLEDAAGRLRRSVRLTQARTDHAALVRTERDRLIAGAGDVVAAARELLAAAGLREAAGARVD